MRADRAVPALLAIFAGAALLPGADGARAAGNASLVDLRGRLVTVEAVTVVEEGGASAPALRMRRTAPDGSSSEEFIPGTLDSAADTAPSLYFDAPSSQILLLWIRHDGSAPALSAATLDESGLWSPGSILETGAAMPLGYRADLDAASRIHVVWETSGPEGKPALRHRVFDAVTFEALGRTTDPVKPPKRRDGAGRTGQPGPEGGTDEPGPLLATSPSSGLTIPPPPEPVVEDYGVVAACDAAIVWTVAEGRMKVATWSDRSWSRGEVRLEPGADPAALAAGIARRFCRP